MNNHKKTKHPELLEGQPKRGRGRPRKYPPKTVGDFESTKYDSFFNNSPRNPEEGKTIDVKNVVPLVFDFLYKGQYMTKLFSHPKTWEENPILKNLDENTPIADKKTQKTLIDRYGADEVWKSQDIINKRLNTFKKNYSDEFKKKQLQLKREESRKNTTGYATPFHDPSIRKHAKETLIEHLGVDNPWKSPEVREKIKQKNKIN